jgi:hypothetical protein
MAYWALVWKAGRETLTLLDAKAAHIRASMTCCAAFALMSPVRSLAVGLTKNKYAPHAPPGIGPQSRFSFSTAYAEAVRVARQLHRRSIRLVFALPPQQRHTRLERDER